MARIMRTPSGGSGGSRPRPLALALALVVAAGAAATAAGPLAGAQETPAAAAAAAGNAADSVRVARIQLVVETTGPNATGTLSHAELRARMVVSALGQAGVTIREVVVHEAEVMQLLRRPLLTYRGRPPPPPKVEGYRAWVPVTVWTPEVHRAGLLTDRAAGAGAYLEAIGYETVPAR